MAQLVSSATSITERGWEQLDSVASNFDHEYDVEIANELASKPNAAFAQYAGWDFCGYVYHDGTQFVCEVWRYRSVVGNVEALTMEELMERVSDCYGHR